MVRTTFHTTRENGTYSNQSEAKRWSSNVATKDVRKVQRVSKSIEAHLISILAKQDTNMNANRTTFGFVPAK